MVDAAPSLDPASFTTFGPLLRFLRRRARLTQRELSIEVGYNFGQISRLEAGQRLPDPSVVAAVFLPALDLDNEQAWAARLLALAETAREQAGAKREAGGLSIAAAIPAAQPAAPQETPANLHPLLVTKLYLPRTRPGNVPRPRLFALLNGSLNVPLTVVSSPAGFGKTTLLADWSAALQNLPSEPRVAWLSLDEGDNDPVTFLRYLVAALQTVTPATGDAALAMAQLPQLPPMSLLVRVLLNDLTALPQQTVLVLDDYHLITTPGIHTVIQELLNHLPPMLHLVVATRVEPPLPLARWRARRQLVELRAADLRFSAEEAEAFLTEGRGLPLSAADVAALDTRTEGWVAGLQLAALAMHNRSDLAGFIHAFTGSNRFVVDYLDAEVFERQPPHLQKFLLQTSILDRLCAPLCDAVMGLSTDAPRSSSAVGDSYTQLLLTQIEQANLFLLPLDDERRWYRYHHLFGELLHERLLRGAQRADVQRLHQRASAWYEGQGLIEAAVHHAMEAEDWDAAARLIDQHGMLMMLAGRMQQIHRWLEMIPVAIMHARPLLAYTRVGSLMISGDYAGAEAAVGVVERGIAATMREPMARLLQGAVAIARSGICYFLGDAACAVRYAQTAADLLPEASDEPAEAMVLHVTRPAVSLFLSSSYRLTGELGGADEQLLNDAILRTRALKSWTTMLNSYTNLAYAQLMRGQLRRAQATYAEGLACLPHQLGVEAFAGGASYFCLAGEIYREWDELEAAERELAIGLQRGITTGAVEADVLLLGFIAMARVQFARGNAAAAFYRLNQFVELAHSRQYAPLLAERSHAARARLQLAQGELAAAERWAAASNLQLTDAVAFAQEYLYLTLARVRLAQGRAADVLLFLERCLADAEAKARVHSGIEILALQALAHQSLGNQGHAITALRRALALAEPEGYIRMFVDEGEPMAALLQQMAERRAPDAPQRAYIQRLLGAFPLRLIVLAGTDG